MFLSCTATSIWANVSKFWEYFAAAEGEKFCFRPLISSRSYIWPFLFAMKYLIYDNPGKYIRVFQSLEIYKVNEHAHFRENLKSRKLLTFVKIIHVSCVWNDFKMFISPHNGFSFVAYHVSWWQVTKVKFTKISQQSNMYIYIDHLLFPCQQDHLKYQTY